MTDKPNTPQEIVENLLTDPDVDAERKVPPVPPQTIGNEVKQGSARSVTPALGGGIARCVAAHETPHGGIASMSSRPVQEIAMSRAINVNATNAEVSAMCAKHKTTISAIEALPSGGTRVVMMNADDAAVITRAFKSKILGADAKRTPLTTRWR